MKALDRLAGGASVSGRDLNEIRRYLHQQVIDRLDLAAAANLSKEQLKLRLKDIVERLIATEGINLSTSEREEAIISLLHEITGLGPLEKILVDQDVSDILINGPDMIFVERAGRLERFDGRFRDNEHLVNIISRIVGRVGRRVDEASPMVDARLEDGSRVNAIIPPLALDGAALSIRRFGTKSLSSADLVRFGALSEEMMRYLEFAVRSKCNIVISGGTGAGKTTLLNALSNYIPGSERIITLEDSAELRLQQSHVVRLESRPPNIEGRGAITIGDLMKNALRMRPDRIVVGEVRGGEALDMLQAMNTGHEGSMGTLHANTPSDALQRLMTMITMSGVSLESDALQQIISRSLHLIVQANRLPDGQRKITSITEILDLEEGGFQTNEVFTYKRHGIDEEGRINGEHIYLNESQMMERFYQFGVIPRPR
ncbi:MAG: CpaF family protein [Myxococcota bacterium]|nr:CpaF family protein [Myxococcota bacterium]